ncbi:hypothetical protein YPPY04_3149, partial [Yersinia pestis PY-04]
MVLRQPVYSRKSHRREAE